MTNQKTVVWSKHSGVLGFLLPVVTQNPLDVTDGAEGGRGEPNKAQVFFVIFWENSESLGTVPRERCWTPASCQYSMWADARVLEAPACSFLVK